MSDELMERIAREVRILRVPMSHTPRDAEYLRVLAYRVEQERAACERRLVQLSSLSADIAATAVVGSGS